ncbi:ABC transporter permease subunit [Pimelobacter simplex]|uniref:ABC transporter permease subunit n=1 Tax=Nocardioides simplex TaxID=2045 RepID=UPI0019317899|nr:ATP-binding cassette domain-containing protein [Pimelobacter simplex]
MTLGTLVLGLQSGFTIGLLAVGLVLIYKANRFINLAHAQLGAVSALLMAKWVLDWDWNWWAAFALSILVGGVVAVTIEWCLIRPVRKRGGSSLPLLLMSIGASQLLLALCYFPVLGPDREKAEAYPQPFESKVDVGGVLLSGMDILTLVLVPVIVAVLATFLRTSSMGRQIRAAANNIDAARLCGISVTRVSLVTWGIVGALSAMAAVLAAPKQASFDVAALGPNLLLLTLGAAAFGAFVSLPAALGGGLVLGIIGRVVAAETSNEAASQVVTLLVVLAVLAIRNRALATAFATGGSAAPERRPVRIPSQLQSSRLVRFGPSSAKLVLLAAAVALPFQPWFSSNGDRFLLVILVVYALVGISLTMLLGLGGQVSLGQFAIVGFTAFLAARLVPQGWTLPALLLMAAVVGAAVMAIVGLPALTARGLSLAITTLGLAVVGPEWLFQQEWFSGTSGGSVSFDAAPLTRSLGGSDSHLTLYFVALVVLVLAIAACGALRRAGSGRVMIAIRDNQRAANALGVFAPSVRLSTLAICGAIAGVAGVLYADAFRYASHAQFGASISIALLALPIIGGLGSAGGAVGATVFVYGVVLFLGPVITPLFDSLGVGLGLQLALSSFGVITMILQFPTGLAGGVQSAWQAVLDRLARNLSPVGRAATSSASPTDVGVSLHGEPVRRGDPRPAVDPVAGGRWARRLAKLSSAGGVESADPLVVTDVTWSAGGVSILNQASIRVGRGEIVGLIGPNGAGKTSLMNVVSGVVTADAGTVEVFGRPVLDLPADFRAPFGAARSFQDASLFSGLTVRETIQVALHPRYRVSSGASMIGAPWARAAEHGSHDEADLVMAHFGLSAWANTLTSDLSTGTRRICDLAAQVATRPRLLMLDEPTGGVSQRDAEAFSPLLRSIRDELNCSILIVEHDMPLLMSLCDRVYALEAGRVIAAGTPPEVREHPAVIASYLGSNEVAIKRSGTTHAEGRDAGRDPSPPAPAHVADRHDLETFR